jgi:hypothetical protein
VGWGSQETQWAQTARAYMGRDADEGIHYVDSCYVSLYDD